MSDAGYTVMLTITVGLLDQVKSHFGAKKFPVDVKYIDPTYMIRARACNSSDHIFCSILGQNAVSIRTKQFIITFDQM